jgi:hypothetical protein
MGKTYIVSSSRGVTRVQAWPKKRGPAKTQDDKDRQHIFKLYQALIKRLDPVETEYEREEIKQHNRTHRGQRGSAAIRFRDWQTQRLYGRGLAIDTDIGITFYPPAIHRDATDILDHVTDDTNYMITRNVTEWQGLAPGIAGQILTAGAPGQPLIWAGYLSQ